MDRPRPVLCLFPLRWPRLAGCRGGAHVGGVRSSRSHPRFGDRCSGTRKAARLSRRATRPREIEQSERTCRPTAARPPYGRIDLLRRRGLVHCQPAELRDMSAASRGCYNPRRSAARPARVGRVDRAPPALAGCGVVVWVFTPLLQPAAVVCVLVLRSRRGRDWTGFRAGSSRPPGCVSRGCSARWGYRCGSSRRRRARRSSCSSPPSSAPPPRIARRRAWPPSRRPP